MRKFFVGKKSEFVESAGRTVTRSTVCDKLSPNWLATGSKQKVYELAVEKLGGSAEIKHLLILNE